MKKIFFLLFIVEVSSCNIGAGSYPYVELYPMNINETKLITAIENFKKNNPKNCPPSQLNIHDGKSDKNDNWYNIYFYYPEEDQLVLTWTRYENKNNTSFALVSINQGLTLGHWKSINEDFTDEENKEQLHKFEERILNKIKKDL